MRKLLKGIIGYEEQYPHMCTVKSGFYLISRMKEISKFPDEEYYELKNLFELFERNIERDKKWFINLTLQEEWS